MSEFVIKKYHSILSVGDEWDDLVKDNIYLTKKFVAFMEKVDQCKQEYYMIYNNEKLDGVFMMYHRAKYNLTMFTKFKLMMNIKMMYVPLSVTRPGIAYNNPETLKFALNYISKMKGPKMVLNLEEKDLDNSYAVGLTCPKCILYNNFKSFDDYMSSLRSHYRRRYLKAFEKSKALKLYYLSDNKLFSEEMYQCYLNVYNKSRIRVEKLSIDFFRGDFFKIFVLEHEGKVMGFGQMLENGSELIFEFVGVNYEYNNQFDTYHRILLEITRYGIDNGFKTIDFGQTADESKLKLGCKYTYLYAYLHHSNKLINAIDKKIAHKIEYRPIDIDYNVFKD